MTETTVAMTWQTVPRDPDGRVRLAWDDLTGLLKRAYPGAFEHLLNAISNHAQRRADSWGTDRRHEHAGCKEEALTMIGQYLGGHKSFNPIEAMHEGPSVFAYWVFSEICYRVLDGKSPTSALVVATMDADERGVIVEALGVHSDTVAEGYVSTSKLSPREIKDLAIRIDGAM